jgi:hypothetical protein
MGGSGACRCHDIRAETGTLHVVDATGLVHALPLQIQALLPIQTLVPSGH